VNTKNKIYLFIAIAAFYNQSLLIGSSKDSTKIVKIKNPIPELDLRSPENRNLTIKKAAIKAHEVALLAALRSLSYQLSDDQPTPIEKKRCSISDKNTQEPIVLQINRIISKLQDIIYNCENCSEEILTLMEEALHQTELDIQELTNKN
jgi:hypothetical protein